ncbi:intermembrane phospholipid transport protein YdbH family protein [Hellea balneolensis]|uniref:intermembrane phospholipid transport protein YdbH family protein n=1 Tax=Hellea balneolensis TaxID=287478 RepID=UPI00040B02B4|nr:YdbH domain-containing protein [Hellea balneolensis]
MSVTDTEPEKAKPSRNRSKGRSVWRWILWAVLGLIFVCLIIAAYLWLNRYKLLEQTAEELMLEQGIRAELSIESISKTKAVLKDVSLFDDETKSNEPFFSAQKIETDYSWRDALEGRFEKMVFTRPKARLTLDESGKIIDGWVPPSPEDSSGNIALPPEGISIKDGLFTLSTPFGDAEVEVDAQYFSNENLTAALNIAPASISYKDWQMQGGGRLNIELKDTNSKLDLDLRLSNLEHPVIDASEVRLKGDLAPILSGEAIKVEGELDIGFGSIVTAQLMTGEGEARWDGRVERDPDRIHPFTMSGTWSSQTKDVVLPDPARRKNLAQTLSLSETLLNAPIAQNFSGQLTRQIETLLSRSDVEAAGGIKLSAEGLSVNLSVPATLRGDTTRLRLEQTDWAPLYNFTREDEKLRLAFHANLTEPAGLTFREGDLVASSPNGWQLGGLERFSADISTSKIWQSKGIDGRGARLAPFKSEAVYKGLVSGRAGTRNLLLSGGVDYDGVVPGGYVTGLKTAGRMSMDLRGSRLDVSFAPKDDAPILISKIETDTAWRGENVSARLLSGAPVFSRRGKSSNMSAKLADVSFIAIDETNTKNLDMSFQQMEVEGEFKGEAQNWDVLGNVVTIRSEDMPGPGTIITTPEARIQVQRTDPKRPIQFFMAAPTADIKTQLVTASAIRVEAAGQPDKYRLRYSPGEAGQGRVKFAGDALPRLPMTGEVNFEDGVFKGTAVTTLPLTDDTPIDISYLFKDGQGTADVVIPELRFTPKGLQPQYLVSALRGKIAEVQGLVQANIKLAFAAGQPLQSSGTAKIIDMNFGTLPGPLTGVNTEMSFSNMFPLQSQGRQTLTVDRFDPGFPLENGVIEFEMIPDGVRVYSARWPLGEGFFSLDPFDWLYSNKVNRVVMRIENVSIGEFLKDVGDGSIKATGDLEGTLPIVLSGVDVKVENGELFVRDGGRIQYQSKQLNAISQLDGTDERAVAAMRQGNYRDAAFEALKDFEYDELRVTIDGPLDGAIGVNLKFDGKNADVLGGQPFRFDIALEGELLNILRSFNTNAQIKSELARRGLNQEEEIPDLEQ